ncbi:MAG TPA: choline-sulfatase [Solirubrobacteraceae bacterium]|jgi:choline-sulfatase|nr:choline-sulfatase [Solirubrobacteraceae bacterium]
MATTPDSFLILMADQLAAGWLPAYGHPVVQTPHLSELAEGATVFESAYTAFPLCAPARAAMLTGRYASRVGVYDNAAEFRAGAPTVVHALRAAGYYTAVSGKMHFVGPDQLHGFEDRLTTDIYPADVDWTPDWRRPLEDPLPWYHTMESVLAPGICAASLQTDYDDEVAFQAGRKLYEIARHRADQPYFLFVSFTNPHDPWEIPQRFWDRYRRDDIDDPAVPSLPLHEADPHSRRLRAMCQVDQAGLTGEQIRRARHGYYAAISYLDERIGQVLGALRESGLEDRTTILFCADHGEMLGERGLWYKMSFLEQSARVPLIVRGAGGGARVAQPVSLADFAPTVLELAGLPVDAIAGAGDGVSLAEALSDGGSAPEHPVVSEYHAEGVQAPAAMVRSGAHKLIVSLEDPDLLYDLAADPRELHDVSGAPDSEPVLARLRGELQRRLDLAGIGDRVRASQRERFLVSRALREGRPTPWDHEPIYDAAGMYIRNREDMYELQRRARLDSGTPE